MCEGKITGNETRSSNPQSRFRLVMGANTWRSRCFHQVRRHQGANCRLVHERMFHSRAMEPTLSSRPNRDDGVTVQEKVKFSCAKIPSSPMSDAVHLYWFISVIGYTLCGGCTYFISRLVFHCVLCSCYRLIQFSIFQSHWYVNRVITHFTRGVPSVLALARTKVCLFIQEFILFYHFILLCLCCHYVVTTLLPEY